MDIGLGVQSKFLIYYNLLPEPILLHIPAIHLYVYFPFAEGDAKIAEKEVSLSDLLVFATGASEIPSIGFDEHPALVFMHDPEEGEHGPFVSPYPVTSTCAKTLKLPVMHTTYEGFKSHMLYGIINAWGFGLY